MDIGFQAARCCRCESPTPDYEALRKALGEREADRWHAAAARRTPSVAHRPLAGRVRAARHRRAPGRLLAAARAARARRRAAAPAAHARRTPRRGRARRAGARARGRARRLLWQASAGGRRRRPDAPRRYRRATPPCSPRMVANTPIKLRRAAAAPGARRTCRRSPHAVSAAPTRRPTPPPRSPRPVLSAPLPAAPLYARGLRDGALAPLPRRALPVRHRRRRPARRGGGGAARAVKVGIVGLPNAGKSSLFNALTRAGAQAANYPFTTVEPNVAVVPVPDDRLDAGGGDHRRHAGGARDDRVPRHRRARARRAPGRGARQPVPRRTSARPTRSCTWCASTTTPQVVHPEGRVDPLADVDDDRDRAAVRRPRAGRAPAGARGQAGASRGDKALVAEERWLSERGRGAARGPAGAHRAAARRRPGRACATSRRSPPSRCSTWRTWPRASRSSRRRSWWSTPRRAARGRRR